MVLIRTRQRPGRLFHWLLATLLVIIAGLAAFLVYDRYFRRRPPPPPDPALAQELAGATILDEPVEPGAGDWPGWRGPRRDGVSTETGLLIPWPREGLKVLWRQPCGTGYSSLAVAGGRLYTLEQSDEEEAVTCRDAATGQELWRHAYPSLYRSSQGDGPRGTPAVVDGRVYAVGGTGIFHCLDAASGQVLWRHDLLEEFGASNLDWGVSFSPLVEGELVYTNPGGSRGRSVAAFDRRDGRLVWKALDDPAGYSSPIMITAAGVRQVVVFTARHLAGLSPEDGTVYWQYPWETRFDVNAATPIFFRAQSGEQTGDYLFISSGYDQGCAVVKVVAGSGGRPEARTVWLGKQMRNHFSTCVRHGPYVYGFDESQLTCLDLRTGQVAWQQSGFQKGSLFLAAGHLIVLSENRELALVEATPQEYREKGRMALRRRRAWTVPVLAGGRLYVRDQQEIVCLELRDSAR